MTDQLCGETLTYDRKRHRSHARLIAAHVHRCKLPAGHDDDPLVVGVHECRDCTLCWESRRRPAVHCICQASLDPRCPTHGTPPASAQASSGP